MVHLDPTNFQSLISAAIQQGIATGLSQLNRPPWVVHDLSHFAGQSGALAGPETGSESPHRYSRGSSEDDHFILSEEEGRLDVELSEDEGFAPEQPISSVLFQPGLFSSLLFKAKLAAGIDVPSASLAAPALSQTDPVCRTDARNRVGPGSSIVCRHGPAAVFLPGLWADPQFH